MPVQTRTVGRAGAGTIVSVQLRLVASGERWRLREWCGLVAGVGSRVSLIVTRAAIPNLIEQVDGNAAGVPFRRDLASVLEGGDTLTAVILPGTVYEVWVSGTLYS